MFKSMLQLPLGFSEKYNMVLLNGYKYSGTPFEAYLDDIRECVGSLYDRSGISEWLYLDDSVEINAAVSAICSWVKQYRGRFGYSDAKIMIVIDDRQRFDSMSEKSIQNCKTADISFCTIISDHRLYDLIEQKDKWLTYEFQPNYHDDINAYWRIE